MVDLSGRIGLSSHILGQTTCCASTLQSAHLQFAFKEELESLDLAQGIATGNEDDAVAGANQLMDYLEQFARRIIDQ